MSLPFDFAFYPIIDQKLIGNRSLNGIVNSLISGGVRILQLRVKEGAAAQFYSLAKRVRELTLTSSVKFILNDRLDIALAVGADGVHLGDEDLPIREARRLAGGDFIIGATVRDGQMAKEAERAGATYVGLGPIFDTNTKNAGSPLGTNIIPSVKERCALPVIAIGGINLERVERVLRAGADGIAVISDLLCSPNIKGKTQQYIQKIKVLKHGV